MARALPEWPSSSLTLVEKSGDLPQRGLGDPLVGGLEADAFLGEEVLETGMVNSVEELIASRALLIEEGTPIPDYFPDSCRLDPRPFFNSRNRDGLADGGQDTQNWLVDALETVLVLGSHDAPVLLIVLAQSAR